MRMIQIQLLLSNTLHRQLFIVNLPRYEVRGGNPVSTIRICRSPYEVQNFFGNSEKNCRRRSESFRKNLVNTS
jgi:hypothetical protein